MHQLFLGRLSSLLFPTLFSFHFQVVSFPSPVPFPPASFVQPRSVSLLSYSSSYSSPYFSFQLCLSISTSTSSLLISTSCALHLHSPKKQKILFTCIYTRVKKHGTSYPNPWNPNQSFQTLHLRFHWNCFVTSFAWSTFSWVGGNRNRHHALPSWKRATCNPLLFHFPNPIPNRGPYPEVAPRRGDGAWDKYQTLTWVKSKPLINHTYKTYGAT